ncbi:hypothetical protein [Bradyrhizobium sp. AC87j1]|uniref:hypothetical protein n=1 Tax=Bradyrhizobium sp. AC87j1 TaxID=2055894 RepID=UPI00191C0F4B|nr:hypothetical protein [Bradyrhizobium sp. AC87j1]
MAAQEQQLAERKALARRSQTGIAEQLQTMLHARIGRQLEAGDIRTAIVNRRDIRGLEAHRSSHASHGSERTAPRRQLLFDRKSGGLALIRIKSRAGPPLTYRRAIHFIPGRLGGDGLSAHHDRLMLLVAGAGLCNAFAVSRQE